MGANCSYNQLLGTFDSSEDRMPRTLEGRVALITGASSGIGEGAAIALAAEGAVVALTARRADRLDALRRRITEAGGQAIALPGDVTVEAVAKEVVGETIKRLGRLDILVNSAGIVAPGRIENADTELWRRAIEINLLATLYTCSAAIGPMRAQGSGDIINISSTAGRRVANGAFAPYCASKYGLTAMTEGLRQEVGGHGIRVCIIEPGATTTEVSESITDPMIRESMRKHVSKEGAMKPQDIAAAILFVVALPARANVSEILIRPTIDVAPM
jgi:NADP-dependent 3-hydroxy acid dehydrogenase YdfG